MHKVILYLIELPIDQSNVITYILLIDRVTLGSCDTNLLRVGKNTSAAYLCWINSQ